MRHVPAHGPDLFCLVVATQFMSLLQVLDYRMLFTIWSIDAYNFHSLLVVLFISTLWWTWILNLRYLMIHLRVVVKPLFFLIHHALMNLGWTPRAFKARDNPSPTFDSQVCNSLQNIFIACFRPLSNDQVSASFCLIKWISAIYFYFTFNSMTKFYSS